MVEYKRGIAQNQNLDNLVTTLSRKKLPEYDAENGLKVIDNGGGGDVSKPLIDALGDAYALLKKYDLSKVQAAIIGIQAIIQGPFAVVKGLVGSEIIGLGTGAISDYLVYSVRYETSSHAELAKEVERIVLEEQHNLKTVELFYETVENQRGGVQLALDLGIGTGIGAIARGVKNNQGTMVATTRVVVPSDILSKQGTSSLVGNFRGLEGKSVTEIISRIPRDWKMAPQKRGEGIRFFDTAGYERIRIHGPGEKAPPGSNSASGWILRISDRMGRYYDNNGKVGGYRDNGTHIPIQGNPTAGKKSP